jgi:hypothetical protein
MIKERHSHQRVKGPCRAIKGERQRVEAERSRNTVCVVLDPSRSSFYTPLFHLKKPYYRVRVHSVVIG